MLNAPYIISPTTHICNQSLISGVLPDRLKYSIIKPIYKEGNKLHLTNYRPISLLTSFSKIFEKNSSVVQCTQDPQCRTPWIKHTNHITTVETTQPTDALLGQRPCHLPQKYHSSTVKNSTVPTTAVQCNKTRNIVKVVDCAQCTYIQMFG